jgi:hypothetical protein
MRRWLPSLMVALALPGAASAARAVDLVQGWQMVSLPVLEPMPLDRFDVIDQTTGERRTFAAAAGADPWVGLPLWGYDPATRGYVTVDLGQEVAPERGYWIYVFADHPLRMVPTYDIADYFPLSLGWSRTFEALSSSISGTHWVTYSVDRQATLCGLACLGRLEVEQPLGGGTPFDSWRNWFSLSEGGLSYAGLDMGGTNARFTPPVLFPSRMYPGQTVTGTITASLFCGGPGVKADYSITLLGVEKISTALGDLVCLRVEEAYDAGRRVTWYARGVGEVRGLTWDDQHLVGAKDAIAP